VPELDHTRPPPDFCFVDAAKPEDGLQMLLTINIRDWIPKAFDLDPVRDIQVLRPMNRGSLGARSLNVELQKALNPPGEERVELRLDVLSWRQGRAGERL